MHDSFYAIIISVVIMPLIAQLSNPESLMNIWKKLTDWYNNRSVNTLVLKTETFHHGEMVSTANGNNLHDFEVNKKAVGFFIDNDIKKEKKSVSNNTLQMNIKFKNNYTGYADNSSVKKDTELSCHATRYICNTVIDGKSTEIKFSYSTSTNVNGKVISITESISISSVMSLNKLQKWYIDEVYNSYIIKNWPVVNKQAYVYALFDFSKHHLPTYERYDYDFDVSFDNVYCEYADAIKRQLDTTMQGKSKLSILMHGQPGGGKTSIIRLVAGYTKRDLFMIKLDKIKNTQNLMNLFLSNEIYVNNKGTFASSPKERILVFEDVDADSNFLAVREDSDSDKIGIKEIRELLNSKTVTAITVDKEKDDPPTLSDFLNIMDGVFNLAGMIMIFTTNKPENLDPAFRRPGRIDLNLEFKELPASIVKKFVCDYYHIDIVDSKLQSVIDSLDRKYMLAELSNLVRLLPTIKDFIDHVVC